MAPASTAQLASERFCARYPERNLRLSVAEAPRASLPAVGTAARAAPGPELVSFTATV